MFSFTRQDRVLLLLLLITTALSAEGSHKTLVRVTNSLDGGADLTLHCKSKDDDLGVHLLHFNGSFQFRFWPNFWGTTKFGCSMEWGGKVHWFDIYRQNRDTDRCGNDYCLWIIKDSGPFLWFRPFYWGTSQFFCFFKWQDTHARSEWFDIYIDRRDKDRCTVCQWIIQAPGPCTLNQETNKFDICFPWNP
ncbi:conserved hypothetical protein [Ricinus communis]|uniref:S-protein homolog n=1 Tax=Ricinus communis TaxID=3988 RepID=B9RWN9_RICCO|nr:conserved hypothetical protein [Ricinus communis]